MTPLRVKMAAFKNASEKVFAEGQKRLEKLIEPSKLIFIDNDPDVLFFLSGGSERSALATIGEDRFYTLITTEEGNSNASAMEVKAALTKRNIDSVLLDLCSDQTGPFLENLYRVQNALKSLQGKSLGLIGEVSEWLVASDIKPEVLDARLGIKLQQIPWASLPDFNELTAPESFLRTYNRGDTQEVEKAGQVFALLKKCAGDNGLDALSVECFSLVTTKAVSGCLALAELNREKLPAACEGDIASAAGMMLSLALTDQVPWMANVARLGYEKTLMAHCTISPDLITDFDIPTHYETGLGTAIRGHFKGDEITVFRIDEDVSKIFIAEGTIIERPNHADACRTQVEVKFENADVDNLRDRPLGNHHLVLPGKHKEVIKLAGRLLKMEIIS